MKKEREPVLTSYTARVPSVFDLVNVTVSFQDGAPFDCFINVAKSGKDLQAHAEAVGRIISAILRHGGHPEDIETVCSGAKLREIGLYHDILRGFLAACEAGGWTHNSDRSWVDLQAYQTSDAMLRRVSTSFGPVDVAIGFDKAMRPSRIIAHFVSPASMDTDVLLQLEVMSRLSACAVGRGVPLGDICEQLRGIGGTHAWDASYGDVYSLPDAVARAVETILQESGISVKGQDERSPQDDLLIL